MKKTLLSLTLFILLQVISFSLTFPELGDQVFNTELGAHPLGMGAAFSAMIGDPNTLFYNPGGLPWSKGIILSGKDFNNLSAAQAIPTGSGITLGIGYVRSKISDLVINESGAGDFSSSIILFSVGTKLSSIPIISKVPNSQSIGLGLNFKSILSQLATGSFDLTGSANKITRGWELDFGFLYNPSSWFSFGAVIQNTMPKGKNVNDGGVIDWNTGGLEGVPAILRSGISLKPVDKENAPVYSENNRIFINFDAESSMISQGIGHFGLEWIFQDYLSLRGGFIVKEASGNTSSFGLGFNPGEWGIDFASSYDLLKDSRSYIFSISYDPNIWTFTKTGKEEKKREEKTAPMLKIDIPREITTYKDSLIVSGEAKNGTKVFVNDQLVILDKNNRFEVVFPLQIGKNLIAIKASLDDFSDTANIKVLRKSKVEIVEEKKAEEELKNATTKDDIQKIKKDIQIITIRKEKLEALITIGVIDAEPDKEIALNAPMLRGEFASWVTKSLDIPLS